MYSHEFQMRVSYGETDQMGYMYYGNYARYYEIGRVEAIRALGMSYKELEDINNIIMPVIHVDARFIFPALYDELLRIRTELRELPDKLIHFHTIVFNEQGRTIHRASVKLFFVEKNKNKRISAPDFFVDKLRSYFE